VTDALLLAVNFTWDPGFRGILSVLVAVVVLCGGVFLIMATNSGARLGFQLALTGLTAWLAVMGVVWTLYGIGPRGPAPSWEVVDVVRSAPASGSVDSRLEIGRSLPLPAQLPDPVEVRDSSDELLAAFPPEGRDPNLGDLVSVDDELKAEINDKVDPWRILETSNKFTGETQSVVGQALGPDGQGIFSGASDYVVLESFLAGGKPNRTDDSILARLQWKAGSIVNINPDTFYAAVQLQPTIPQQARPGQAPPSPVVDETRPVYTVILERVDQNLQRLPQAVFTLAMFLATAVLAWQLHTRDKLAQAQRAAGTSA
jgi:hypothetical protein